MVKAIRKGLEEVYKAYDSLREEDVKKIEKVVSVVSKPNIPQSEPLVMRIDWDLVRQDIELIKRLYDLVTKAIESINDEDFLLLAA